MLVVLDGDPLKKVVQKFGGYHYFHHTTSTRPRFWNCEKQSFLLVEFFLICNLLRHSVGGNGGPWDILTRAWLALLDAWSDGNATPHDRSLHLGEVLAVGLAETRPFLGPFLSRS